MRKKPIEIFGDDGKADFGALQNWDSLQTGELLYYAFDLLWVEGIDLTNEPLTVRRDVLKRILPDTGRIRYSDSIEDCGIDFFHAAKANGLEGIIAKNKHSIYQPSTSTRQWYKINLLHKDPSTRIL